MSAYSPYNDTPASVNDDGNRISISFERTSDTTANVIWGIPANIDNPYLPPDFYNGILLLLDTKPIEVKPVNGTYYQFDTTLDVNKFMGDGIGDTLVIGAFYNDKTTSSIQLTDLLPNTNYYIAGFAIDNIAYYHDGIFSYSIPMQLNKKSADTKGRHTIELNALITDTIDIDNDLFITIDDKDYTFNIQATNYQELVDQINLNIIQIDNVYLGDTQKNTNAFRITNNKLFKFDGYNEIEQECFFGPQSANILNVGDYWLSDELYKWDEAWEIQDSFKYIKPINELSCSDHWLAPTKTYTLNNKVWKAHKTYYSFDDPALTKQFKCNEIWFNNKTFSKYNTGCKNNWSPITVFTSDVDPLTFSDGYYWYNGSNVYQLINKQWVLTDIDMSATRPTPVPDLNWYDKVTNTVYTYNVMSLSWIALGIDIINVSYDVTNPDEWYWFDTTDLYAWDILNLLWVNIPYITNATDPTLSPIKTNDFWFDNTLHKWDGSQWVDVDYFQQNTEPKLAINDFWYDTINKLYRQFDGISWTIVQGCSLLTDPSIVQTGQLWYNTSSNTLYTWNGINWQTLMYSTSSLKPKTNDLWFNTSNNKLFKFNRIWVETQPRALCEFINGNITITSNTLGSKSRIVMPELHNNDYNLFYYTSPRGKYLPFVIGTDSIQSEPTYKQLGVGTDGSLDERRNLIERILMLLGYPAIQVELDKAQLELCVDLALGMFRKLSSSAYDRSIFFLDLIPNQQSYLLTDKNIGLNRIVSIQAVYRRNSAYVSSAQGNGIYAQQLMQWLYNPSMGMDLVSYHIISEYTELMDILFATRIVHRFNERTRKLDIFQNIGISERVMCDCSVERTEQELIMDRISSKWILQWALGEACVMLANIRGKYGSVPGAGGSVSLNSSDLQARADEMFDKCRMEINTYLASEPEKFGMESTMVLG
jgi:hypothetical protein